MSMMIRRRLRGAKSLSEASQADNKPLTETPAYTKTDIARMNKENLVSLARDNGIENVDDMSGNALKSALMAKFGL